jgi:ferredoxin--NADP+ reductase
VEEVVVIGRRGPLQTAFTTLELRELADLEGVDVVVDPAALEGISDDDAAAVGKVCKQNIKVLRDYAGREPRPGHRRIVFRFLTSPIEIAGDERVEKIVLGRNELVSDDSGRVVAKDTGAREELPVQLVVRSVGYRGVPTPGLPFDDKSGTIPHTDGRVDGSRNEYVVGWIKRGPSGVIGTNKKDGQEAAGSVLADAEAGMLNAPPNDEDIAELLAERGAEPVDWDGWKRIDEHEVQAGTDSGRPRVKLSRYEELLDAARAAAAGKRS